jgi:hypothetical protein
VGYGFDNSIYLDFHLAELQFSVTPHKLEALSYLSCNPALGFFFSGVSGRRTLTSLLPFLPYSLTGLQSTRNPLKVILLVPSKGHLDQQLSFSVVTHATLVVAITDVHPAVD